MYKIYLKQALQMLKQNKFISVITITGTALAIMMIMVVIVAEEVKRRDIAPEIQRSNTYYVKYQVKTTKDTATKSMMSGWLEYDIFEEYLSEVASYDAMSLLVPADREEGAIIRAENSRKRETEPFIQCDAGFWKIMAYDFVEGAPFSEADFDDGLAKAVVSEKLAFKLFGNESALNKTIYLFKSPYQIVGVVKDVSQAFEFAYAELWVPYTSVPSFEENGFQALYLLKDKEDVAALEEEVRAAERRYNAVDEMWDLKIIGPYNHRTQMHASYSYIHSTINMELIKRIALITIILIVPAVNLSGFSMSRIKRRTEEIGIRKAFGARNGAILSQILYENLITSLAGGIIGLIFSYFVVIWLKEWLLNVSAGSSIPLSAFVSPYVFLYVTLLCILLNLISSIIPAYKASTMNIVSSINHNNL